MEKKRNKNGKHSAADEDKVERRCKYFIEGTRKMLLGRARNRSLTVEIHRAPFQ